MNGKEQKVVSVALIRNKEGKILVQKRVDPLIPKADGKWELPGGVIEFGETPEEAAIRECKEEVNCIIEIIRLLPFAHTRMWKRTDGQTIQAFVWYFEARYVSGEPKASDPKVAEVMWATKEEALNLDALSGLKKALEYIK